jgi:hypothetical protein
MWSSRASWLGLLSLVTVSAAVSCSSTGSEAGDGGGGKDAKRTADAGDEFVGLPGPSPDVEVADSGTTTDATSERGADVTADDGGADVPSDADGGVLEVGVDAGGGDAGPDTSPPKDSGSKDGGMDEGAPDVSDSGSKKDSFVSDTGIDSPEEPPPLPVCSADLELCAPYLLKEMDASPCACPTGTTCGGGGTYNCGSCTFAGHTTTGCFGGAGDQWVCPSGPSPWISTLCTLAVLPDIWCCS